MYSFYTRDHHDGEEIIHYDDWGSENHWKIRQRRRSWRRRKKVCRQSTHDDEKYNRKRLMRHDKLFLSVTTTKCHSRFPSFSSSLLIFFSYLIYDEHQEENYRTKLCNKSVSFLFFIHFFSLLLNIEWHKTIDISWSDLLCFLFVCLLILFNLTLFFLLLIFSNSIRRLKRNQYINLYGQVLFK